MEPLEPVRPPRVLGGGPDTDFTFDQNGPPSEYGDIDGWATDTHGAPGDSFGELSGTDAMDFTTNQHVRFGTLFTVPGASSYEANSDFSLQFDETYSSMGYSTLSAQAHMTFWLVADCSATGSGAGATGADASGTVSGSVYLHMF